MNLDHLAPIEPSPDGWLAAVLNDFPAFLCDHASCEKKASGMALNVASHYPDKPSLVRTMTDLAVEELSHWREVMRVLLDRGIQPRRDERDAYVHAMQGLIRSGPDFYLVDRLLIAALIERRGAERFARIGGALEPSKSPFADLATFYRALAASESRHWEIFFNLAVSVGDEAVVHERFVNIAKAESHIMLSLPFAPRLH